MSDAPCRWTELGQRTEISWRSWTRILETKYERNIGTRTYCGECALHNGCVQLRQDKQHDGGGQDFAAARSPFHPRPHLASVPLPGSCLAMAQLYGENALR